MSIATQASTIATQQPGTSTDPLWSPESYNQLVTDASPFSLVLDAGKQDAIQWIAATDELIVGTAASEFRITGKKDKAISARDYHISQQTIHGSKDMMPLITDEAILFVNYVGRELREFKSYGQYYWHNEYIAPDLLTLAEHITQPNTITTMAFQKKPEKIIWATLANGDLISCTYDPKQKVVAWAQHPIQIGEGQTEASELSGTGEGDYTKYYVGYHNDSAGNIIVKANSNGTIDTSWGNNGFFGSQVKTYAGANALSHCRQILQLDDGSMIVVHNTFWWGENNEEYMPALTKITVDGDIDTSWGHEGHYMIAGSEVGYDYQFATPTTLLECNDGSFILWGHTNVGSPYNYHKLSADGELTLAVSFLSPTRLHASGQLIWYDENKTRLLAVGNYGNLGGAGKVNNMVALDPDDFTVDTTWTGGLSHWPATGYAYVGPDPTGTTTGINAYDIMPAVDANGFIVLHSVCDDYGDYYTLSKISLDGSAYDTSWGQSGHGGVNLYPRFYPGQSGGTGFVYDDTYNYVFGAKADGSGGRELYIQRCEILDVDGNIVDFHNFESGPTAIDNYHHMMVIDGMLYFATRDYAPAYDDLEHWGSDFTYTASYEISGASYKHVIIPDETTRTPLSWTDSSFGIGLNSVCVIPGSTEDEVWISVGRKINGSLVRYIERMKPFHWTDQEDCFFVDSGVTYDSTPTTTMTGLDHLEGETVAVLGDGLVQTSQTVSSGQITVTEASVIQAGLSYTYTLKPMRLDQRMYGTTKGSTKRIAEVVIDFENSNGTQYDNNEDTYDVDFPDTDVYTGDIVVHADGGFSVEDPFEITGSAPLPCTIRAIVPRLEVTGR